MNIDNIVEVEITVSTSPTRPSFGMPLLVGYHDAHHDFVRTYASLDAVKVDFDTEHCLTAAAATAFVQGLPAIMIGRRAAPLTQTLTILPTVTIPGHRYRWTIAGVPDSYTNGSAETSATIATAIATKLATVTRVVATAGVALTVAAATPGDVVDLDLGDGFEITDITADATTAATLAAIDDQIDGRDVSYYGVTVCDSQSTATALEIADAVAGRTRLAFAQTPDDANLDRSSSSDTFAALKAGAHVNVAAVYHRKIGGTEWLAVGALATFLASSPSKPAAFLSVAGVTPDVLTPDQKIAADAKHGNIYVASHRRPVLFEGRAASGRYLDITRFVDWQNSTIDFDVFTELAQPPKEPYTERGLSRVKLVMEAALHKGVVAGGIVADSIVVRRPTIAETTTADRAQRIARGFTFAYHTAPVLQSVQVTGTLYV